MGIYATPEDVGAEWPGYDTAMESRTDVLIGKAEALILDTVPQLKGRIAAGVVSERTVAGVVVDMVVRVLRNPDGYRSEQDGDYEYTYAPGSYTYGNTGLTLADLRKLRGSRNAVTIGPGDDVALRNLTRAPRYGVDDRYQDALSRYDQLEQAENESFR